jgi:hypothetical protein
MTTTMYASRKLCEASYEETTGSSCRKEQGMNYKAKNLVHKNDRWQKYAALTVGGVCERFSLVHMDHRSKPGWNNQSKDIVGT